MYSTIMDIFSTILNVVGTVIAVMGLIRVRFKYLLKRRYWEKKGYPEVDYMWQQLYAKCGVSIVCIGAVISIISKFIVYEENTCFFWGIIVISILLIVCCSILFNIQTGEMWIAYDEFLVERGEKSIIDETGHGANLREIGIKVFKKKIKKMKEK